MSEPETQDALSTRLLRLLGGKWIAAAVSTAASLGLAEALESGPLTLDALADRLGCDPGTLLRLLRVLAAEGLVEHTPEHSYALTPYGALLRHEELGPLASFVGAPFSWDPWSSLPHSLRTGEAAFQAHHGQSLFDYLDDHPSDAAVYHAAIDSFTRRQARALADAYDFSAARRVADLGGGNGTLLVELLTRFTSLEGVLLDRAAAIGGARAAFDAAGIASRCRAVEGDFFEALPTGLDHCVIKHVLHNWDDEHAARILTRAREAVGPDGRVLVIEGLLLAGDHPDPTKLLDLEMLALCGAGRERTKPEMRRLLHAAGLRLERTSELAGTTRLLVTSPR